MPPNQTVSYSLARRSFNFYFRFFSFGNWLLFWPSYTVTLSVVRFTFACSLAIRLLSFLWMIVARGAHTMTTNDFTYGFVYFVLFCLGLLSETSLFESVYLINNANLLLVVFILFHSLMPYLFASTIAVFFGSLCIALVLSSTFEEKKNQHKHNEITNDKKTAHIFRNSSLDILDIILCEWETELCVHVLRCFVHTHTIALRWECIERLFTSITITRWLFSTTTKNYLFVKRNVSRCCSFVFIRAALLLCVLRCFYFDCWRWCCWRLTRCAVQRQRMQKE